MKYWLIPLLIACVLPTVRAVAQSPGPPRGELLYSTHCIACHTSQIHWRDNRLATDWTTLAAQVRRWQANTGLGWSESDIVEVTRYLNELYYHFRQVDKQASRSIPPPGAKVLAASSP